MPDNRRIVTPDLNSYIQGRKNDIKTEINCISNGTIIDFDPLVTQTVTVQINYVRVIVGGIGDNSPNTDQTENKTVSYPQLLRCPIIILSGGNSYLTFPIEVGDECLILFNDRDIDTWWNTGATANPPNSSRLHDLSDAIILVGVRSLPNMIPNYNMLGPQLTNAGALIAVEDRIKISVDTITLGATLDTLMIQLIALANATGNPAIATAITAIQVVLDGILK